jgi:4'-phosphopantetheinyl transferase EntD
LQSEQFRVDQIEMTPGELEQHLTELFAANVAVSLRIGLPVAVFMFPEEAALVANAVEKRRLEFATGRDCARKALAKLGGPRCSILAAPDRSPIWPPGFAGSISHTDGACGAVAVQSSERKGIGLDIENTTPLSDEVRPLVCSDADRAHFSTLPKLNMAGWDKIAFCGKEAFHKCQHPLTQRVVDFRKLSIRFSGGSTSGTFLVQTDTNSGVMPELSGFWFVDGTKVYTGCTCR